MFQEEIWKRVGCTIGAWKVQRRRREGWSVADNCDGLRCLVSRATGALARTAKASSIQWISGLQGATTWFYLRKLTGSDYRELVTPLCRLCSIGKRQVYAPGRHKTYLDRKCCLWYSTLAGLRVIPEIAPRSSVHTKNMLLYTTQYILAHQGR